MKDMLVRLYDVKEDHLLEENLNSKEIKFFRILPPDIKKALDFAQTFGEGWANECLAACTNHPASCFIAVKDKKIIGFACYDATAKDFFGPTGVSESERGQGVGMVLLKKCLCAMAEEGYAYAVIGGVGNAHGFYEKSVGAVAIEGSSPGIYATMIQFT